MVIKLTEHQAQIVMAIATKTGQKTEQVLDTFVKEVVSSTLTKVAKMLKV